MPDPVRTTSFDGFEFDLETLELSRDGRPVSLQPLPARVLAILLRHAGRLVPREAFHAELWPRSVIDQEKGLNTAIRQVRTALEDRAANPRFIETLPRRGYRFIHPVRVTAGLPPAPLLDRTVPAGSGSAGGRGRRGRRRALVAASLLALTALALTRLYPPAQKSSVAPEVTRASLAYAMARHAMQARHSDERLRAVEYFEQALVLDPERAEAWSGLAEAHLRLEDVDGARAAARRALALDPKLPEANRVLGALTAVADGELEVARPYFEAAVAEAPAPMDHLAYAFFLFLDGKVDVALEHVEAGYRQDPLSAALNGEAGLYYLWAERPTEASERCALAAEVEPQNPWALACLATSLEALGRFEEASIRFRQLMVAQGALPIEESILADAVPHEVPGLYRTWRIHALESQPRTAPNALALARLYAAQGAFAEAMSALERAASDPPLAFASVRVDPVFRPLQGHPEFESLTPG